MKSVLFINLSSTNNNNNRIVKDGYNVPIGMLSIASYLALYGHDSVIVDYCYEEKELSELCALVGNEQIKIIAFSVYTINVDEALKMAKYLKKMFPQVTIVFGGPHATLDSAYCYQNRYVDYVIKGEGESALLELLEGIVSKFSVISPIQVNGICYREQRQIMEAPKRMPISNLDLLPLVMRNLVDLNRYKDTLNISSSRGCPANCIYCAGTVLGGKKYRVRDIENVILEIAHVKAQLNERINVIYFIDDTFTVIKKRVMKYMALRALFGLNFQWRCESRIDVIDEPLLDAISQNGCRAIHFGVESGSQEVLDRIQKSINLASAYKKITYAASKSMLVCCYFMLGHYCDTRETMQKTCDLIKDLSENYGVDASVHYNTPYPGTYQFENRELLGLRLTSDQFCDFVGYRPIVETEAFSIVNQIEYLKSISKYLNKHDFAV